jgi:hypothetical protein
MYSALLENVSSLVVSSTHLASSPDSHFDGRPRLAPVVRSSFPWRLLDGRGAPVQLVQPRSHNPESGPPWPHLATLGHELQIAPVKYCDVFLQLDHDSRADLSHADICEISTELEAEENLDPQPPGHVHHHRRGRLRRQLSEAHRHPSPTVLSHQRDWPGRDVGAEQCRGAGTARLRDLRCVQSLGRPGCSGRRNCNVNLDELRGDRPDLDYEPQQAGGIPRNWTRHNLRRNCCSS